MRIIKTDKHEREGNDCMIYNTLTLYEHGGEYFFQVDEKITGWAEDKSSRTYDLQSHTRHGIQYEINAILDVRNICYGTVKFDICEMN